MTFDFSLRLRSSHAVTTTKDATTHTHTQPCPLTSPLAVQRVHSLTVNQMNSFREKRNVRKKTSLGRPNFNIEDILDSRNCPGIVLNLIIISYLPVNTFGLSTNRYVLQHPWTGQIPGKERTSCFRARRIESPIGL